MPIDMHAHWIPESMAETLRSRKTLPYIEPGENGMENIRVPRGPVPIRPGHADLAKRIADSARLGVDRQVLSTSGTFSDAIQCAPPDQAPALARVFNDGLAEACRDNPGTIYGVAALPCSDMSAAVEEFERVIDTPGIIGALLPGNGFLSRARAEHFHPIFEAAQHNHAHILIHSGNMFEDFETQGADLSDNEGIRRGTLDMQARLSSIMITLCMTDFLDPYPDVTVQVHNLGGNMPFEVGRADHLSLDRFPDRAPPSTRLDRVIVDCNSFGASAIEMGVALYGADKIVLGTDGSDFGVEWSLRAIAEADIGDAARRAILDDNAARIIEESA